MFGFNIKSWVSVAPTRTFPFGPWFHISTFVFLFLAGLAIIAGAMFTVAWEAIAFYRPDFDAKDDYWLRSYSPLKNEKLCEKENLQLGNTYYTTNGLFNWMVDAVDFNRIYPAKSPYDAGLTGYSGEWLGDRMDPPRQLLLKYHFATRETDLFMSTFYRPPREGSDYSTYKGSVSVQTQFGNSYFDRPINGLRLDSGSSRKRQTLSRVPAPDKFRCFAQSRLDQVRQRSYLSTTANYSPSIVEITFYPKARCSAANDSSIFNCPNDDIFFEYDVTEYLANGTRVFIMSEHPLQYVNSQSHPRPTLPQWDLGLGYILYSAALYDFGIDWPFSFITNNAAAEKHLDHAIDETYTVDGPAPNAQLLTQYRCVFKVLKSVPNIIFSVLTTFLSLMAGLWAGYKLFWELVGAKWHDGELEHFFKLPDPDEVVQPTNDPVPQPTPTAVTRGSYSLASTSEK